MGKAAASTPSYVRREASLFPLFSFSLPERALFAPTGHLPHWEERANGRSFEPTCASNECVFAGSWRDVPYKYAALRVLTQCTTSLKAGMSDRAPLRFPHLSFIRLEPYPARYARHLPHAGNTTKTKLSGRTFLAPHRGSCPKGLCKRTGFLGVKRRENPVRRHFERSEMRGLRSGIA